MALTRRSILISRETVARPHRRLRSPARLGLLASSIAAGTLLALCASASAAGGHASAVRSSALAAAEVGAPAPGSGLPVTVTIDPSAPGPPVPRRFLGLSFEAAASASSRATLTRGDLVTLLRSLGPGVLRFGGITADKNVAWVDAATPRPAWASSVIAKATWCALGVARQPQRLAGAADGRPRPTTNRRPPRARWPPPTARSGEPGRGRDRQRAQLLRQPRLREDRGSSAGLRGRGRDYRARSRPSPRACRSPAPTSPARARSKWGVGRRSTSPPRC